MATKTNPEFEPVEIAYRLPKGGTWGSWKRSVVRTEAAHTKKIDDLIAKEADIHTRPFEG